jgi:hypothetical protein
MLMSPLLQAASEQAQREAADLEALGATYLDLQAQTLREVDSLSRCGPGAVLLGGGLAVALSPGGLSPGNLMAL